MIRMFRQDSSASNESSTSSSDMIDDHDDASSSSTSSLHSNGPLYELSDLMAQLPIKRGLSKFYEGKSESFTCLSSVKSSEELAKKGRSGCHNLKRKMKACNKRYEGRGEEGCLDTEKSCINNITKPTISKKGSRGTSFSSLTLHGRRGCSFFSSTNSLPPVPVYKH